MRILALEQQVGRQQPAPGVPLVGHNLANQQIADEEAPANLADNIAVAANQLENDALIQQLGSMSTQAEQSIRQRLPAQWSNETSTFVYNITSLKQACQRHQAALQQFNAGNEFLQLNEKHELVMQRINSLQENHARIMQNQEEQKKQVKALKGDCLTFEDWFKIIFEPSNEAKAKILFHSEPKKVIDNDYMRNSIANWLSKKRCALQMIIENYSRVEQNAPIFDNQSKFTSSQGKIPEYGSTEFLFIGMHRSDDGSKHGVIRAIRQDCIIEGSFKKNQQHGLHIEYSFNGQVYVYLYKDGEMLSCFGFDKSFTEISNWSWKKERQMLQHITPDHFKPDQ